MKSKFLTLIFLLVALVGLNGFAQAPTISYVSPQAYNFGQAIPTLAPSGSGVAALGYNTSPFSVGTSYYLWYPFNGNANDASGKGNNGVLQGAPSLTSDRFNNPNSAYNFNGTNQYISTTTSYPPSAAPKNFTISVWFKTSTPGGLLVGYSGSQTGLATQYDRMLYMDDYGYLFFGISSSETIAATARSYADGLWHHAVATASTSTGLNLYIDGVLENSSSTFISPEAFTVNGYWRVGYNNLAGWEDAPASYYFTGTLDDIAVTMANNDGLDAPRDVAVDVKGNIYDVLDLAKGTVTEIPVGGAAPVVIGTAYKHPYGIGVDAAGNVYVADLGNNVVKKIPAGGGTQVTVGSGFQSPTDAAVDSAGNVYVSDESGTGAIKKIPAGGGTPVIISPQETFADYLAADAAGDVFFANQFSNNLNIEEIKASDGTTVTIGTGFSSPQSVAVDAAGNVYVTDNNGTVSLLPAGGGAKIALASGLYRPAGIAADVAGNVYVTERNSPAITKIKPSGGYFINRPLPAGLSFNSTNGQITGTPVAESPATDYTITAYNSHGSTSAVVNIKVTSAQAFLAGLTLSKGTLNPDFSPTVNTYTDNVSNAVSSLTVTPTTADAQATVKVNGASVTSGSPSAAIPLAVGANTITIAVAAQDGVTTKTYTVTVNRATFSTNDNLANLALSNGILTPAFDMATTSYSANVGNTVTNFTVTPTAADTMATITINGNPVKSGSPLGVGLNVGSNQFSIVVTASDGVTTKQYFLQINRAESQDDNLTNITLSSGAVSPVFVPATTSYTAVVDNNVSSITLTPTVSAPTYTVTVNGTGALSGMPSDPIALHVGVNNITINVTAQDGRVKTYTVAVTRSSLINVNLSSLTASNGTLIPGFSPGITSYDIYVGNMQNSMTLTPTAADPSAAITLNGTPVTSGSASTFLPLTVGANTFKLVVTGSDGTTKRAYTLIVHESKSEDNYLASLITSAGLMQGLTVPLSITENVPDSVSSITVTAATRDNTATLTVNGSTVTSGTASGAVELNAGANTITIIVTAQDAKTLTYTLTVNRGSGLAADNTIYQPVSVDKPTDNPQLAEDGVTVHQAVSPNGDGINDYLIIDNIANYPDNKLAIMNQNGTLVFEAKGYNNVTRTFDGHSNKTGQMQLPGTYFYSLDYTVNGIIRHKTGFLVLKY